MAKFQFKAQKVSGEIYEGEKESLDKYSLYRELKKDGDLVITAIEIKKRDKFHLFMMMCEVFGKVSLREKIIFTRNLGSMIGAGLTVSRALGVLEKQSGNNALKKIIKSLSEDINKGVPLSEAMKTFPKVFTPMFISMVKAGEESGKITISLSSIANQLEKTYLFQKKLLGAMIYPAIILLALFVIGIMMMVYVVPSLASAFKEFKVELPISTKIIIAVSNFLQNNFLVFIAMLAVFIIFVLLISKIKKVRSFYDYIILKIPVIGNLVKETNSARTTRTLSSLLTAGVPVLTAMKITEDVLQNLHYKEILRIIQTKVEKGEAISGVFMEKEKFYPIFVGEMINVGEETGKLPQMLMEVAEFYESEVDQKTKDISTVIEPVIMIIVGLAVGFFAVSIILPIYSLSNAI